MKRMTVTIGAIAAGHRFQSATRLSDEGRVLSCNPGGLWRSGDRVGGNTAVAQDTAALQSGAAVGRVYLALHCAAAGVLPDPQPACGSDWIAADRQSGDRTRESVVVLEN